LFFSLNYTPPTIYIARDNLKSSSTPRHTISLTPRKNIYDDNNNHVHYDQHPIPITIYSYSTTTRKMTTAAPAASAARNSALQSALERSGIQFKLSAGGAKYICTIKDRNAHKRQKTERTDSSESINSGASTTSTASDSSTHASAVSTSSQH
jgi:hypothetical protein